MTVHSMMIGITRATQIIVFLLPLSICTFSFSQAFFLRSWNRLSTYSSLQEGTDSNSCTREETTAPFKIKPLAMTCKGYCTRCDTIHELPRTPGAINAVRLLREKILQSGENFDLSERWWLENENESNKALRGELRNDFGKNENMNAPSYISSSLLSLKTTRGKMVGALEAIDDRTGEVVFLAAFAGKLGGKWVHKGWVPPLAIPEDVPGFASSATDVAEMTVLLDKLVTDNDSKSENEKRKKETFLEDLRRRRSNRATEGLRALQEAQIVHNFRGESTPLPAAHHATTKRTRRRRRNRRKGISRSDIKKNETMAAAGPFHFLPLHSMAIARNSSSSTSLLPLLAGGVGDCAAPRLLNAATKKGLRPLGVAEMFVGATGGMSLRRKDGELYDACEERCQKIVGWMLCGLDDL